MNLTPEQKQVVAQWVAEGAGLAEVQRRLESEFGLRMTYMDVRFLIDDLAIELPEPPKEETPEVTAEKEGEAEAIDLEPEGTPGSVSVTVDKIARPGALVSGSVRFSDGVKATWLLDQMGRLGLDGVAADYQPSEDDMIGFQRELQKSMRAMGL